jgi:CRISPR type I-E-associated protein CasA/Cse1
MSFADAACHLIAEQSFAMSAGAGYVSAHHAYAAVFLVVGSSLFETLMLNLTICNSERPIPAQNDAPVWEASHPATQARAPRGYLESLTWLPRRILLIPDGEQVRKIVYKAGPRCEHTSAIADPMLAYRVLRDSGVRAYSLQEERGLWRDIPVLLSATGVRSATTLHAPQILTDLAALVAEGTQGLPETRELGLRAYGVLGEQASIRFWREIALPLPLAFLGDNSLTASLQMALDAAETGASCLHKAANRLAADILSPGNNRPDESRVRVMTRNLGMEHRYWGDLERPFRRLIRDLSCDQADVDSLVSAWVDGVVRSEILKAFDEGAAQLDGRARSLRAIAQSSQLLRSMLSAKLAHFGKGSKHE